MYILTKKDIQETVTMADAIEASRVALTIYTKGEATVPLRTNIDVPDFSGQGLYMPALTSGSLPSLGVKIVSVYPDNIKKGLPSVPSTMVVQDPETGIVSAILDGTFLTQLRTAAVQGAATDALASKTAKIAGLIGTGGQGFQQAIAMMTVRQLEELRVFDIDFDRAKAFANALKEETKDSFSTVIIPVKTAQEAVQDADIVTSVTTSKTPTFDACDLKPGVHVNGVGAYTPDMVELPNELIGSADTIVLDTRDGVLSEAGDIIQPLEKGLISEKAITGELGELLLGQIEGRKDDSSITVFKTVGTAVLDTVTAQLILEKAKEQGTGVTIDF